MTLILLAALAAVFVLPYAAVKVLALLDQAVRDDRDYEGWGPSDDVPLDVWLTDLGRAAVEQPGEFVLDEANENWGPAS